MMSIVPVPICAPAPITLAPIAEALPAIFMKPSASAADHPAFWA